MPATRPLRLRPALATDLPAVMALERAGFEPGIVEDDPVFAHRIAAFPEGFLLAETAGEPAGYFSAEIWREWGLDDGARFDLGHPLEHWLDRHGRIAYLASMTLAPTWRGQGFGRTLLRAGFGHLARQFPQLRQALLIVNEHWHAARALYAGEGFSECGRLPAFFTPSHGPRGDAIVMACDIMRLSE